MKRVGLKQRVRQHRSTTPLGAVRQLFELCVTTELDRSHIGWSETSKPASKLPCRRAPEMECSRLLRRDDAFKDDDDKSSRTRLDHVIDPSTRCINAGNRGRTDEVPTK